MLYSLRFVNCACLSIYHCNCLSNLYCLYWLTHNSKVHRANMGPIWVLSVPDGPHVGPMNHGDGCEVWRFSNISQKHVIQGKFIKSILSINSSTSNSTIHGEAGTLLRISCHIKSRNIDFFMRLFNGTQSKLSCILYLQSIEKEIRTRL